jgi:hypothetical protein
MPSSDVFISSCSRRQLARRRWARAVVRYELPTALGGLLVAAVAFVVGRGGF